MSARGALRDGALLCAGTFTRIPVPPPSRIDRRVAGIAMALAPVVGAVIAVPLGLATQLLADITATPALAAVLAVSVLAWLTRALHLDGLADTADALGSGAEPGRALEIARRSDIGPFGVIVLVLVLAAQASAVALLAGEGLAGIGIVVALIVSRLAATASCVRGIPAARSDGLGATVAGSVKRWVPIAWLVLLTALALLAPAPGSDADPSTGAAIGDVRIVALIGLAAAVLAWLACVRTAERRLGGVTGDTLGWTIELTATTSLVAMAVAAMTLATLTLAA